jgi:hypothetical protein
MEIGFNIIVDKIDDYIGWFSKNDLYSYDPCDFVFSKFLPVPKKPNMRLYKVLAYGLDTYFPSIGRLTVKKQKSVISSALFSEGLMNMINLNTNYEVYLPSVNREIDWLINKNCEGYCGYSWGLPFDWCMGDDGKGSGVFAPVGTPFSTLSLYPVRAMKLVGDSGYRPDLHKIYKYASCLFMKELKRRYFNVSSPSVSLSYSPLDNFYVVNVNSYAAATLCLISEELDFAEELIQYVLDEQNDAGYWNYWGSQEKGREEVIDSLHQCYIIQNLMTCYDVFKTSELKESIRKGVKYFSENFIDGRGVTKFSIHETKNYIEEYEIIDIAESINMFMDVSKIFPEYHDMVHDLMRNVFYSYSNPGKPYFKTRQLPKNGVDVPYIRWGQSQIFHTLTRYYGF